MLTLKIVTVEVKVKCISCWFSYLN